MNRVWWLPVLLLLALAGLGLLGAELGWWSGVFRRTQEPPGAEDQAALDRPARDVELRGVGVPRAAPAAVVPADLPPPVDLDAVDRDGDLHGVVVDSQGAPVAGAEIQALAYPWRRTTVLANEFYDAVVEGPGTRSAADGTFAVRLRPGVRRHLEVTADGYAPVRMPNLQAGERVRIVLTRGVSLLVRVVDPNDRPLGDVDLELTRRAWQGPPAFVRAGRTDESGTYRFENLPASVAATLEAKQGPAGGWATGRSIALPDEGEGTHEIVIAPGRLVRGRVTDGATGLPVAEARVGMGWTFFRETYTDADGRYALGGWKAGDGYRELHVRAEGYAAASVSVGEASTLDVELVRGFAVVGVISGEDGAALPNVPLAAIGSRIVGRRQRVSRGAGRTDASGRFLLSDLGRDMPHVLVVMAEGQGRTLLAFDPPAPEMDRVDLGTIVLPRGRVLAGTVRDGDDQVLHGIEVTLTGCNDDVDRLRPGGALPADSYYGRSEERRTDDLGRFAFADLAPGAYTLTASREAGTQRVKEVRVPAGRDVRDVALVFQRTRPFRVRVSDEDGNPVADVLVNLEAWGAGDLFVGTEKDGSARFDLPLDVEQVRVQVLNSRDAAVLYPDPVVVAATVGETEFQLVRAAFVRGRLLGPNGESLVKAQVEARRDGEVVSIALTEGDGAFELRLAPGDPVDLVFEGDTYVTTDEETVELRRNPLEAARSGVVLDGAAITLRAREVSTDAALRVRVLDPEGKAVAGVTVGLKPTPAGVEPTRLTDAAGRASFSGLVDRPWYVFLVPPAERMLRLARHTIAEVRPRADEITIRLATPLLLEGTIVDPEGEPVTGATLQTGNSFGDSPVVVKSDVNGHFVLPLPPGVESPMVLRAWRAESDRVTLFAEVTGVDVRKGPLRIALRPHRGW